MPLSRITLLLGAPMLTSFGGAMAAPANTDQESGMQAQLANVCSAECSIRHGAPASAGQPCQVRCGGGPVFARQDSRRQVVVSGSGILTVTAQRPTPIIIANVQRDALVSAGIVQVPARGFSGTGARTDAPVAPPSGDFDWQLSAAWIVSARLYADVSVQVPLLSGMARLRYMF